MLLSDFNAGYKKIFTEKLRNSTVLGELSSNVYLRGLYSMLRLEFCNL